jgi:hypothetical protein
MKNPPTHILKLFMKGKEMKWKLLWKMGMCGDEVIFGPRHVTDL